MNLLQSADRRMKAVKENSIVSFNAAANYPIDFIEFDVQVPYHNFLSLSFPAKTLDPTKLLFITDFRVQYLIFLPKIKKKGPVLILDYCCRSWPKNYIFQKKNLKPRSWPKNYASLSPQFVHHTKYSVMILIDLSFCFSAIFWDCK